MAIGNVGPVGPGWQSQAVGALGGPGDSTYGMASPYSTDAGDPIDAYFECITSCSLDDGECVTTCTAILRETS